MAHFVKFYIPGSTVQQSAEVDLTKNVEIHLDNETAESTFRIKTPLNELILEHIGAEKKPPKA